MKKILIFLVIVARIWIAIKICLLLYFTNLNPDRYPLSELTWWIYFLVFDIWLQQILPENTEKDN